MPDWKKSSKQHRELPELEVGMRLEVVTPENKLIFVGKIESVQQDTIQIADVGGADVPHIPYNSVVKLRGFHNTRVILLEGLIGGSAQKFWRIDRLQALQISEQREYFRQNIGRQARVMCINEIFGERRPGDEKRRAPMECRVANISATGAMILSEREFHEGDWLWMMDLVLLPEERPFALTCIVRRVVARDGITECGCEFYEMEQDERERLIKSILLLQRQERQERREDRE